jgi:hypothetical protein
MTERQWWKCPNQRELLEHVRERASPRKLRLYACALARGDWEWLRSKRSQRGVEVAELFADGQATAKQFAAANDAAFDAMEAWGERWATEKQTNTTYAVRRAWDTTLEDAWEAAKHCQIGAINKTECDLLRDLFGPTLFRAVPLDPAWRTATVEALAHAAYDERLLPGGRLDPQRLAVLADALEEAGCADPDLLGHLRTALPHIRGCWVVDLLTGRL